MIKKILMLFIVMFEVQASVCDRPLIFGWEDWPPYQYQTEVADGSVATLTGLDIELVTKVIKNMGCEVQYLNIPWKRHLEQLAAGKVDIASRASYNAEREKFGYYSNPYRQESVCLFVKKADLNKYVLTDLRSIVTLNMQIGVESGYYYGAEFNKLLQDKDFAVHIESVVSLNENIEKLKSGTIQGLLSDNYAFYYQFASADLQQDNGLFVKYPMQVYDNEVHVLFSKASTSPEILAAFNNSLAELKQNGEYQKIINKYLSK